MPVRTVLKSLMVWIGVRTMIVLTCFSCSVIGHRSKARHVIASYIQCVQRGQILDFGSFFSSSMLVSFWGLLIWWCGLLLEYSGHDGELKCVKCLLWEGHWYCNKRGPHQSKQSALYNISFKLSLPSQSDLLPLDICSEDGRQFLKLVYGTKEYKNLTNTRYRRLWIVTYTKTSFAFIYFYLRQPSNLSSCRHKCNQNGVRPIIHCYWRPWCRHMT